MRGDVNSNKKETPNDYTMRTQKLRTSLGCRSARTYIKVLGYLRESSVRNVILELQGPGRAPRQTAHGLGSQLMKHFVYLRDT